jgi:hypothetical protein
MQQQDLMARLQPTPASHFGFYFYAAVLHLMQQAAYSFGSWEELFKQLPFLGGYQQELAAHGLDGMSLDEASAHLRESLLSWEQNTSAHLPLRALREAAGLDDAALVLLISIGLIEEDARFGSAFEIMQGMPGQYRPTLGFLSSWRGDFKGPQQTRGALRHLQELGLVHVINPDAPRIEWSFQIPGQLWDAMRGEDYDAPALWLRYHAPERLTHADELIISGAHRQQLDRLPLLLERGDVRALIVRGPQHNGRRTLSGSIARGLGRGMLVIEGLSKPDDERWKLIGPLSTMRRALPCVLLDLSPGETADVPDVGGYDGPIIIVLGKQGGVRGPLIERSLTLSLEMPDAEARRQHWLRGASSHARGNPESSRAIDEQDQLHEFERAGQALADDDELDRIGERFRMTGGNIRRASSMARAYAALEGRAHLRVADVQQASRELNRQALDMLAVRVETGGDWSHLAVRPETMRELFNLESRCRHRERLHESVNENLGRQLNKGVRALFTGPSGTGKTLAARLLASVLQMDLYRLDLSSVVSKYIGETEKSLNQIFSRAEELDVILLLDEGDALLTQRTSVQTSNDRYANLETNYLLQRLESFEGILVVTTNAGERIDGAFQRRMDVVVDFRPPEAAELWAIWQLHLPLEHAVDESLLNEVARRCSLSGGQIRNAVLHASLLALNDGGALSSAHLEAAVQREYRKAGAVCPLRTQPEMSLAGRY